MNTFDNMVLEKLKTSCGANCITDPKNCECFGPMTEEMKKDPILMDNADDDPIYSKDQCQWYDLVEDTLKRQLEQGDSIH